MLYITTNTIELNKNKSVALIGTLRPFILDFFFYSLMKQERENPISVMVFFVPREYNILLIHLMEKVFKLVHKSRNSIEVGAGLFFVNIRS